MLRNLHYTGDVSKARKRSGVGKEIFRDGSWYSGEWEDNLPKGEGTYVDKFGNTFVGTFMFGLRLGKGIYTNSETRAVIRGVWSGDTAKGVET
jgi:hypothetical protein